MSRCVALIAICEEPAGKGVKLIEGDAIVAQAGEELWLNGSVERVVHALVHVGPFPVIANAQLADLRCLPGRVVADAKEAEISLLIEIVDFPQSILIRSIMVRGVEIPHIDLSSDVSEGTVAKQYLRNEGCRTDLICLQSRQAFLKSSPQICWLVRIYSDPISRSSTGRELRVHDQSSLLPFQLPQILLGAAASIGTGTIDFIMTELLENIQYSRTILQRVDSDLVGS